MELFIQEYISSSTHDDVKREGLLERRISPYATLRPGDLAALLKLHSTISIPLSNFGHNHGSHTHHSERIDTLFEKKHHLSTGDSDEEQSEELEVVCHGADQGHIPAEYLVKGIKRHELPVIGVFVHKKICPGFRYKVRRANSKDFFWQGKARTLESIGTGYGCRLTFTGDKLNYNENYFWSDSDPNGFAFSIQAVDVGQKFLIQDTYDKVIGEGVIERIHGAQEVKSVSADRKGVTQHVNVSITCCITYYKRHHHGLKELMVHENQETVSGEAVLFKARSSRQGALLAIEDVYLPRIGQCTFVPDV
ncbi:unnamed protein product [Lymnaea stagnalis]|uniref:Uncharacterized protein n=1 Tax=Lymnaea stagnalis TaxID=6523 RepID=A0AAV2HCD8_LYMST